jgi:hypothetical protein
MTTFLQKELGDNIITEPQQQPESITNLTSPMGKLNQRAGEGVGGSVQRRTTRVYAEYNEGEDRQWQNLSPDMSRKRKRSQ